VDGESWQVVRLSRNRMWGNPAMIAFLERFSRRAKAEGVWNGILVGDISQPRGGPMMTGHASHQVGLDADVWLTPMPDHTLSREEREEMSAVNMVTEDGLSVDRAHWSEAQAGVIKAAAEEPEVDRIFVNAAIKKALCETHGGEPWMNRVRAYWGHNYHFHIRIKCPAGETTCEPQDPLPPGDGCDKSLAWWFTEEALHPRPGSPKPPITMAQLPPGVPDRRSGEVASDALGVASGRTRPVADAIGNREKQGRHDEGQMNACQPPELAVVFMRNVHEALKQLDPRNRDDRSH
jgi:penicillin-insensitive murein DD-endopeptidase